VANSIECQLPITGTCEGCEILELYRGIAADYSAGKMDKQGAIAKTSKTNWLAARAGCSEIPNLRKIALAKADPQQANRAVFVIGNRGRGRETTKIWK
jgi:hypothetical protein